jgi:hypothetical protein
MVFSKNATTTKGSGAYFNKSSDVPFVVHLGGEMGNHLYCLAHGLGLVEMARAEYGIDAQLVLKQRTHHNGLASKVKKRKAISLPRNK